MKKKIVIIVLALMSIKSVTSICQRPNLRKSLNYQVEGGTFLSNGNTPFWQQANQKAEVPNFEYANLRVKGDFSKLYCVDSLGKKKNVDWGAGATAILSATGQSTVFLSQLYVQVKVWEVELSVGRRYENVGLIDHELSSGNYSFSANALPIPKLQLASLGFVEVPFTKKMIAFKFNYADGFLGQTEANPFNKLVNIEDTYFHQKSFYSRIGKPNWKINFYGGFSHQVIWGGEYQVWPDNFFLTQKERYWGIVRGASWEGSRIGNHVANIDLAFSYKSKKMDWLIYRQNLVEDGSLYQGLSNIADGLNGISVNIKNDENKKNYLKKGVLEFLYTYNQGGNDIDPNAGRFGADSYFNHYIYLSGWSYQHRTLGTPFIPPSSTTVSTLPQSTNFTNNNRLWLLHLGLSGVVLEKYQFLTKLSFSNNAGTYSDPFPKAINQFSGLLQLNTKSRLLGGSELVSSVSLDVGKLYPNQVGIYLGIRKNGNF